MISSATMTSPPDDSQNLQRQGFSTDARHTACGEDATPQPVTSRGNKTRGDEPSNHGFIYAFLYGICPSYPVFKKTKV